MGTCMGDEVQKSESVVAFQGFNNTLVTFQPARQKWSFLSVCFDSNQKFNIQHRRYALLGNKTLLVAGGMVYEDYNEGDLLDAECLGLDKNKLFATNRVYLFDLGERVHKAIFARDKKNKSIGCLNIPRSDHVIFYTGQGEVIAAFGLQKDHTSCYSLEVISYKGIMNSLSSMDVDDSDEDEYEVSQSNQTRSISQEHKGKIPVNKWSLKKLPESLLKLFPDTSNPVALSLDGPQKMVVFFFPGNLFRAVIYNSPCAFLTMEQNEQKHFGSFQASFSPGIFSQSLTAFGLAQESLFSFLLFGLSTESTFLELVSYSVDMKEDKMTKLSSVRVQMKAMSNFLENSFFTGQASLPIMEIDDIVTILLGPFTSVSYVKKKKKFYVDQNQPKKEQMEN